MDAMLRGLLCFIRGTGSPFLSPFGSRKNDERVRRAHVILKWLKGLCRQQNFGFFNHEATFMAAGLLDQDGLHLSLKSRRILARELAELIERTLNKV